MKDTTTRSAEEALVKLEDALAINTALYSELLDLGDKLKLICDDCTLTEQAEKLAGIERDYMRAVKDLLDDAAGKPEPEILKVI